MYVCWPEVDGRLEQGWHEVVVRSVAGGKLTLVSPEDPYRVGGRENPYREGKTLIGLEERKLDLLI